MAHRNNEMCMNWWAKAHPTGKIFTMQLKIALVVCILLSAISAWAQDIHVQRVDGKSSIAAYDLVQWSVDLGKSYDNPFNPDVIAVDATFTDEAGKKWVMPAFWYEPPTDASVAGGDMPKQPQWRIRFAPHAGKWTFMVSAKDEAGTRTSESVSFEVAPSANPGMVRRQKDSHRYFQFDSGASYFMVGLNMAWADKRGLDDYRDWFAKMEAQDCNFARVFINGGHLVESHESGIGRYDANGAAYYDRIFEMAEKSGIRMMFTLNVASAFGTAKTPGNATWATNPYNAKNGGPVPDDKRQDYFSNPQAIRFYKKYVRYCTARYSAYTALAFWELWGEQDHLPGPNASVEWTRNVTTYMKEVDPYRHPITTAFMGSGPDAIWALPTIDLTQTHLYGAGLGSRADFAPAVAISVASFNARYHKPHLIGEFGLSWSTPDQWIDKVGKGTSLHNAMWAAAMSGSPGVAMTWWWDNYVQPKNVWHVFGGIGKFAKTIPWSERHFEPLDIESPQKQPAGSQTWSDMVVRATGGWGPSPIEPITINKSGQAWPGLPVTYHGMDKPDMQAPTILHVDLPKASTMLVHIDKVFAGCNLNISLDGKVVDNFKFTAKPGAPEAESVEEDKKYHTYRAVINKDRRIEVPAGKHTITLDNGTGISWVSLKSITFTGVRSSSYTNLEVYSLQDAPTGETLVWLLDPTSDWIHDMKEIEPRPQSDALLSIPMPTKAAGAYTAQWWDTRSGKVVKEDQAEVDNGVVKLAIPTFTRDIALRLFK